MEPSGDPRRRLEKPGRVMRYAAVLFAERAVRHRQIRAGEAEGGSGRHAAAGSRRWTPQR